LDSLYNVPQWLLKLSHIVHKRHQKLAVADDGNTSSRHSMLLYIASGQPISLSCRQTVPE
ncbi:hypothetical protein T06_11100, partial [Trichinella sp. T6]